MVDAKLFKTLLAVASACKTLTHVVTLGEVAPEQAAKLPAGIQLRSMADIVAAGEKASEPVAAVRSPPAPSLLAVAVAVAQLAAGSC